MAFWTDFTSLSILIFKLIVMLMKER